MNIKAPFGLFEVSITETGISGEISLASILIVLTATMLLTIFLFYRNKPSKIIKIIGYVLFIASEIGWAWLSVISIQSAFNFTKTHWDLVILGIISIVAVAVVYMVVYVSTYKDRINSY